MFMKTFRTAKISYRSGGISPSSSYIITSPQDSPKLLPRGFHHCTNWLAVQTLSKQCCSNLPSMQKLLCSAYAMPFPRKYMFAQSLGTIQSSVFSVCGKVFTERRLPFSSLAPFGTPLRQNEALSFLFTCWGEGTLAETEHLHEQVLKTTVRRAMINSW